VLPFALVRRGPDVHVELLGETDRGPAGLNLDTVETLYLGETLGFVGADPAAVFFGADMVLESRLQRAAEQLRLRPLGNRFRPLPAGTASGYPMVRATLERHRAEVPSVETIRLSAVFAGSSIMVGIEQAEKSFACMTDLFKRRGGFVPLDEIRHCIVSLGLHRIRQRLYVESEPWAHEVQAALKRGLRDRELRRHLLFETRRPATIGLAKTSFTLALLGQDTVCLDTRILTRLFPRKHADVEKGFAKVGPTSLKRYEDVEDAFLKGNPLYDPADPIGRARAQWMSWESVGGKGATHGTWLSVVRRNGAQEASPQSAATRPAPLQSMPVPKDGGYERFAATFLSQVAIREYDPEPFLDDPRVAKIGHALRTLGLGPIVVLGGGDYGLAGLDTTSGKVIKLTSDPTEVVAGATLVGKSLEHVTTVYSAHFIRGVKVDALMGWDEEREEEIRRQSRVGVLCVEQVRTDIDHGRTRGLNLLIHAMKSQAKLYPADLAKMGRAKARAKLLQASETLSMELQNMPDDLYNQIGVGLDELRQVGIYGIDVHGGNVGYVGDLRGAYTAKIFDVGSSSSPPGQRVPVAAEECGPEVEAVAVPELGDDTTVGEGTMTPVQKKKFERCVKHVKQQGSAVNPWAVCHHSLGYEPGAERVEEDYIAVDASGRKIAGPFRYYDAAKREADRAGGVVKFAFECCEDCGDTHAQGNARPLVAEDFPFQADAMSAAAAQGFTHYEWLGRRNGNDALLFYVYGVVGEGYVQRAHVYHHEGKYHVSDPPQLLRGGIPGGARALPVKAPSERPAAHAAEQNDLPKGPFRQDPYSAKSLRTDDFLHAQPHEGGWIITYRGEYLGSVKKLKAGWRIDAVGKSTSGLRYDTLVRATELIDAYRSGGSEHAAEESAPVIYEAAETSAKKDCLPWVKVTRDPERYEACLAEARKIGPIDNPRKVFDLLAPALSKEDVEVFVVVLLDLHRHVRGVAEVHRGERSRVSVSVADVMRVVVASGSEGYVGVHNHPSLKTARASEADMRLTQSLEQAAAPFGRSLTFVDHVIICGTKEYYSCREKKLYKSKKL
jgi:hypothetical protein